jgi:hypothetical protein
LVGVGLRQGDGHATCLMPRLRSLRWVASLAAPPFRSDEVTDGSTDLRRRDEPTEDLGGYGVWVLHGGKEEMLDTDVAVA